MPELLLELLCEEIPSGLQDRAADDLRRLVTDKCVANGLTYEGAKAFSTPRRLSLTVHGVTARSADVKEERKGPRVGAPDKAVAGFLRGAGLNSLDQAEVRSDAKKGDFYVAVLEKPGRPAEDILGEIIPDIIATFPWPKSMRWGPRSAPPQTPWSVQDAAGTSSLKWIRPLRSILCTFGPETEDPVIVPFEIGGISSGNLTYGHRFMSDGAPIEVRRLDDYMASLDAAKVVLDAQRRAAIIETEANNLAFAQGLEVVEDRALVGEVAGLVEWPVVLMGSFDPDFLEIPDEVIRLTIRANQKCFVMRDPATDGLANRFLLTANIEAKDGGTEIIAGNEKVIAARLSDARFFYEQDKAVPLPKWGEKLAGVGFHEKLGSQYSRVERIATLAQHLAPMAGAEPELADRAAQLAKADLPTNMVFEFPELQGVMGRYYALEQGEDPAVADAIRDHYKPQGPGDAVPKNPVAVAVALADKLDTLAGFWVIDEKPTGSKDPYALRRAALGVIRLVLENELRLALVDVLQQHIVRVHESVDATRPQARDKAYGAVSKNWSGRDIDENVIDLLGFFADRLKVHMRDEGLRHDLIDAVFALEGQDDLLMIVRRVEALDRFLASEDGTNLLAGYRRAANILKAEEKKDGEGAFDAPPDAGLLEQGQAEERELFAILTQSEARVRSALAEEDFDEAMAALALLRKPVDAFFEMVTVNADDPALRLNRLRMLNRVREAMHAVAIFSLISGG